MEKDRPKPPRCIKCGEQPMFITSMLEPAKGRVFLMFECKCGTRSWTSEPSN
jgi:hypothetical protein